MRRKVRCNHDSYLYFWKRNFSFKEIWLIRLMESLKNEGNAFFKNKEYDKAVEKYKMAVEIVGDTDDKKLSILHSNISATYCKIEDFDLALEHAVMSTRKNPEWYKAWYRLSFVLYNLDKIEQAKKAIEKTLECCKNDNVDEKYIIDLKNEIFQTTKNDYEVLNENNEKIEPNINLPKMDNFMPLIGKMMGNPKIQEMMKNKDFQEKMLKNQSNPMEMFGDPDMRNLMSEMMKNMN